MPQELLRDVLRVGDATGRARRRLSVLPISIAAHVTAAAAMLIIPLAAEVELPPVASSIRVAHVIPVVLPPEPPTTFPRRSDAATARVSAPSTAPPGIAPETEPPLRDAGAPEPEIEGAIGFGPRGIPVPGALPGRPEMSLPPPPQAPRAPVRVGHGIREPRKLVDVAPVYPVIAREAKVEGVVILEAVIDSTGRVDHVRVLRSRPLLDQAAVDAVRGWRYTPTLLNGVPVPVLLTITVRFTLH